MSASPELCTGTHYDHNGDGRCDWCGVVTIDRQEPQPDALMVLRPGDRVLVVFRGDRNLSHVDDALNRLKDTYPGVEFGALVGADQVLVQPGEEPTP